jgi:hypothetical protein
MIFFHCVVAVYFLVKYLGLPVHFNKLRRENLEPLIDNIHSIMENGGGAKIILIQTVLFSIPIYMLSFLKFLKWSLSLIDTL